ncbi:MAG: NlpC/P60 family protein [Micrococcales bacterium]
MKRITKWLAAFSMLAIVFSSVQLSPAYAVPSYPSWAEVQAAKKKVSAKKALIAKLEKYIEDLQDEVDRLSKIALQQAEVFNQAEEAYQEIKVKVDNLQSQVDQATAQADQATRQLGQLAAQMYRDGAAGTSVNFFLNADKADDLLYQLGQQNKLAQQSDTIYQRAVAKQRLAQSLADQLEVAKKELKVKADAAKSAFDTASNAAANVQDKVDESNRLNKTFYAQLAVLRDTSATLERQRAEGLAAEARQNRGRKMPDSPALYSVKDPNSAKVEKAIAFAREQLGERYVLGGMGPNVWDCSGITKAAYASAGIYIGTHSATNQFRTMGYKRKLVPVKQAQRGDLMWYSQESYFDGDKYHVVMYLGGGMMLEAPFPARPVRIVPVRYGELFPYAGRPSA